MVGVRGRRVKVRHDPVACLVIGREDHVVERRPAAVFEFENVGALVAQVVNESPPHDVHERFAGLVSADPLASAGLHERLPIVTAEQPGQAYGRVRERPFRSQAGYSHDRGWLRLSGSRSPAAEPEPPRVLVVRRCGSLVQQLSQRCARFGGELH